MKATPTRLPEVLLLEPEVFEDPRGFFFESFNRRIFRKTTGLDFDFVQDNHSCSGKGVLRGLHYQLEHAQGKLVRVVAGEIFDVAVDLRQSSPRFGMWVGQYLSAARRNQLWVPPGFGHGYLVTSDSAEVLYKTTDYYAPAFERCVAWDDPEIGIDWPLAGAPILSVKDREGQPLAAVKDGAP